MKRSIVWVASIAFDILVFPFWLLLLLLWGEKLRWDSEAQLMLFEWRRGSTPLGGKLTEDGFIAKADGFTIRGWYLQNRRAALNQDETPRTWGATVLGHFGWCSPGMWERAGLRAHETQHRHQGEAAAVGALGWALTLTGLLWALGHPTWAVVVGLTKWLLGGYATSGTAGWLVAWLNSDPLGVYRGSSHERGAYGVGNYVRLKEEADEHMRTVHGQ